MAKQIIFVVSFKESQIQNASASWNCPEDCDLVWYRSEISSGFYPNPVSSYPRSIRHRPEFRNMSQSEFHDYATYILKIIYVSYYSQDLLFFPHGVFFVKEKFPSSEYLLPIHFRDLLHP